jgi:ElaB/YqjD/DUF883 family membrane-anchored ribosome-binding protein
MPTPYEDAAGGSDDVLAQIARLREQVETLMRETVAPAVEVAAERAEAAIGNVRSGARQVATTVRACPLTSVLVAAAVGFLLGRASR